MTEMFGEAWSPMSVPDLAPDDDDDDRCDTDTQKYSGIEYSVSVSTRHYYSGLLDVCKESVRNCELLQITDTFHQARRFDKSS